MHQYSNIENYFLERVGANYRGTDLGSFNGQQTNRFGVDLLTNVEEILFGETSNKIRKPISEVVDRQFDDSLQISEYINEALPDGWNSRVQLVGNDVWLRTVKPNGTAHLDIRLGAAGVIAEIRDVDTGKSLLAPSFNNEVTDRVAQWTIWEIGSVVRHDVPSLPDFEDRFNMTQAGTFQNVLNGTTDVDVDFREREVDVWSVVNHNWKSEQNPHMQGTLTTLTRTTILEGGAILVRRIVRIGEIRLNGRTVSLSDPYFEAWTPFSDSEFNSLALSINANGTPTQWFADGVNIPLYPFTPVEDTRGWAISYDRNRIYNSNNLAVIFGTDKGTVQRADGTVTDSHRFALNSMDFSGGMAILPGLLPGGLTEGAIIDQHLILLPGKGINGATPVQLDALAKRLPPPRVYHAGAELGGELVTIADRLSTLAAEPRLATDNLGRLV